MKDTIELKRDMMADLHELFKILDGVDDMLETCFTFKTFSEQRFIEISKENYRALCKVAEMTKKYDFIFDLDEQDG